MNPWWRRPAADEQPKRPRKPEKAQPDAVAAEAGDQQPTASKAAEVPEAKAAETAAPVEQPTPAPQEEATDSTLTAPDEAAGATDAEEPPAGEVDEASRSDQASEVDEASGASEAAVSPALEAATEPAVPAQPTTDAPPDDRPAPRRRRRRRGRRGGRRRGRGRKADEAKQQESDATNEAPPMTEESANEVAAYEATETADSGEAAPSGPSGASVEAVPGRSAALLDLAALGDGIEADALLARLDRDLGKLVLRRAYVEDNRSGALDRAALHRGGVEIVDVPPAAEAERPATMRIVMDAVELAHTRRGVRTVALVATDEMLPLIARLQQAGVAVVGIGDGSGTARVRSQCDRFIDLSG